MSDKSSTTTLQLDREPQILEISKNVTDCKVLFTVVSENDVPFEFNVIDENVLSSGNYSMKQIDSGYVSGTANNITKPTYLVLKSDHGCTVTVTYECVPIQPVVQPQQTEASSTKVMRKIQANAPKYVTNTSLVNPNVTKLTGLSSEPTKFYKRKGFIIGLIIIGAVIGFWYFKRNRNKQKSSSTTAAGPQAIQTSVLQTDPTSNDDSTFGF